MFVYSENTRNKWRLVNTKKMKVFEFNFLVVILASRLRTKPNIQKFCDCSHFMLHFQRPWIQDSNCQIEVADAAATCLGLQTGESYTFRITFLVLAVIVFGALQCLCGCICGFSCGFYWIPVKGRLEPGVGVLVSNHSTFLDRLVWIMV